MNPYAISLQPDRWEPDGPFDGSGLSLADVGEKAQGLEATYLDHVREPTVSGSPAEG